MKADFSCYAGSPCAKGPRWVGDQKNGGKTAKRRENGKTATKTNLKCVSFGAAACNRQPQIKKQLLISSK